MGRGTIPHPRFTPKARPISPHSASFLSSFHLSSWGSFHSRSNLSTCSLYFLLLLSAGWLHLYATGARGSVRKVEDYVFTHLRVQAGSDRFTEGYGSGEGKGEGKVKTGKRRRGVRYESIQNGVNRRKIRREWRKGEDRNYIQERERDVKRRMHNVKGKKWDKGVLKKRKGEI